LDIIILSILGVLSGAESYDSIELFGKENIGFLKQFLEFKNGIPSHDTINRLFQALNPRQFERCFISWSQGLKDNGIIERVIAIDGKTVRGSKDSYHHQSPLHSVHAWSVENGICLGQMECGKKTNEITTIPKILDLLDIKGSIITIDAMGTQTAIAKKSLKREVITFLGSPAKPCVYPQILATLNRKNFISFTPLSEALNALIFALKDSAEAFVERLMKKFKISS
jgi:predicted transposase YbfD/YdcC